MGFSHYWRRKPELPVEAWDLFVGDVRRLIVAAAGKNVFLGGSDGSGEPTIDDSVVSLNGLGTDSYESFVIGRDESSERAKEDGRVFDCTKTGRRPYDLVVTAILIAAKVRFGDDILVTSDGDDADWQAARDLCMEALGVGAESRFVDGDLVSTEG